MEGLKITRIDLDPVAACRVLETAVEAGHTHGIGYWANVVSLVRGRVRVEEESILSITVQDREGDGHCYRLNAGHVERAVAKMLALPDRTESAGWTKALMQEDYPDGPLADAIIQVACFGRVIYG